MMHVIGMIILGLVVGFFAKLIVPGSAHLGWLGTGLLGIAGGYVGGTLGSLVFAPHEFTFTPPINHSFLGALVGAVLLLLVYRFAGRRGKV